VSVLDHNAIDINPRISEAEVGDYIALLKPRVMSLVIFTALVGMAMAPGHFHPVLAFTSLLCIAVGAGASGALNMALEADIDAKMSRTANRPIPRGRITRPEAMTFGMTLAFFSVMTLGILVNWIAGALLAFTIFFYVVIYTIGLKRWTAQNIVIGGAAGALPPVVAWAAVTGTVDVEPLLLFAIIFFWTPPHFWALALFRSDDYARAGIQRRRPRRDAASDPALHHRADRGRGCALGARLFRRHLRHRLADPRRRHAGVRRQRLCPPRAQPIAAGDPQAVCVLHPLSVRAVCDLAGRGRVPGACADGRGRMITGMADKPEIDGIVLTEAQKKSRRQRSIAIALALGVLVVLFFAVTMVKGPAVLVRPM
jgi:hypothetical protein